MDTTELIELRDAWRTRPREGTARERQAWANGFLEALNVLGATREDHLEVLGVRTFAAGSTDDGVAVAHLVGGSV